MNKLEQFFYHGIHKPVLKWSNYFNVYEKYLSKFVDKEINVLEIGVAEGGSLEMWQYYFGYKTKVFGVDINSNCKKFESDQTKIYIGDQEDDAFLSYLINELPDLDFILDDGGHQMNQQIKTFLYLFKKIKGGGVYICEDTHSSYWSCLGGALQRPGTFIEFTKTLIDYVNGFHWEVSIAQDKLYYTKNIDGLHFYDSMVIIEKCKTPKEKGMLVESPKK
jgi:SAM-dependent methyltransferase